MGAPTITTLPCSCLTRVCVGSATSSSAIDPLGQRLRKASQSHQSPSPLLPSSVSSSLADPVLRSRRTPSPTTSLSTPTRSPSPSTLSPSSCLSTSLPFRRTRTSSSSLGRWRMERSVALLPHESRNEADSSLAVGRQDNFADALVDEKVAISEYSLSASVACGKVRPPLLLPLLPSSRSLPHHCLLLSSAAPSKTTGTSSEPSFEVVRSSFLN